MWQSEDEFYAEMFFTGCIRGVHGEGDEMEIDFDWDRLKELYPEVYDVIMEEHTKEVQNALDDMVRDGLLDVDIARDEDGGMDYVYGITEKGKQYI